MNDNEINEKLREIAVQAYAETCPDFFSELYEIGKQLSTKVVDMSVLVDSGIDCEFDKFPDMPAGYIGKLIDIYSSGSFLSKSGITHNYCKPRMNYWFSTRNFEEPEELVNKLRDAGFEVRKTSFSGCMISFLIPGLQEGYIWPWEK